MRGKGQPKFSCIKSILPIQYPVLVKKYKHYQSIISINIKMRGKGQPKFSFHSVTLEELLNRYLY